MNATMRYVACGDSNTQANEEPLAYPKLFANRDAKYFAFLRNAGRGGWDTRRLKVRLDEEILPYEPNVVTIMLGTNDSRIEPGESGPRVSLAQFEANYRTILNALEPARIVLMSPPFVVDRDDPNLPRLSNARLLTYVPIVEALADSYGIGYVDIHAMTTELCGGDQEVWTNEFTVGDGIHMNAVAQEQVYLNLRPLIIEATAMEPSRLVIRQGCDNDPGLQLAVSDEGAAMLQQMAGGDPVCCWPLHAVLTTTTNVTPSTAMGFGTWTLLSSAGGLYSWERTA